MSLARLLLVIAAFLFSGCGIESVDPEMVGSWKVPATELPDQLGGDLGAEVELHIAIRGPESRPGYAGNMNLGLGCSSYGGAVSSFAPLEFPMVTVAGIGGCEDLDRVALDVMEQILGNDLEIVDGKLAIVLDGERVLLTRRG